MDTRSETRLVRGLRQAYEQKKGRQAVEGAEAGFTLIELMVVLLIMAILLAIAIPTFLGVKSGAQDRASQSNLTNALTSAKASFANAGTYSTAAGSEVAALSAAEPNLAFVSNTVTAAEGQNSISVGVSTDGYQLLLVAYSASGTCWAAEDNEGSSAAITNTPSASGVEYTHWAQSASACEASSIPASLTWATHY